MDPKNDLGHARMANAKDIEEPPWVLGSHRIL